MRREEVLEEGAGVRVVLYRAVLSPKGRRRSMPLLCAHKQFLFPPLSRSTVAPPLHGERVPPTRSYGRRCEVLLFLLSPPPTKPTTPTSTATKGALPQPNSRPLLLPPFFRRGKEGRGAFLAATGYTEGGRGSAPCNEQSKKGCCCSLPPSLPPFGEAPFP